MNRESNAFTLIKDVVVFSLILWGLYEASLYSYLLFHSLAEIFSIMVAFAVFVIGWNSTEFTRTRFFLFLGVAYFFIGGIDLIHTLTYRGMLVFPGYESDEYVQLWIAARYLESISLLCAPLVSNLKVNRTMILVMFLTVTGVILASIFYWDIFPLTYVDGVGLTSFKVLSEYVICMILGISAFVYYWKRNDFDPFAYRLMILAISITIAAELAFTLYVDVYGFMNLIGHYFKIISFFLVYKAVVETCLKRPYDALFRDLKLQQQAEQERSIQLEVVNKELEAFSYSVSHDLRAPLRSIDGFSKVLLERYADKLDERGKHYLTRMRKGSQRMGLLIDDILKISRISRTELKRKQVDLGAIALEVAEGFQEEDPREEVRFEIDAPLIVEGDPSLLGVLMDNLLSNAWKFTRNQTSVRIEVGCIEKDTVQLFYVRDNGIGFDMKYVDKLFRPFQRLHSQDEFEGTGIGLATVKRIITKHGGSIWAESAPEQGASFYFTLHKEKER